MTNFSASASLILASASPRRRDLLREYGYQFSIVVPDVEEIAPPDLTPAEITLANARAKAQAVAPLHPHATVIGADTVVAFEGEIFGKPRDLGHAGEMLGRLNGRVHEVWSGVWLIRGGDGHETGFNEVTRVRFHLRAAAELRAYLERIGPLDKAGAYAAQDDRGDLIDYVEGCFENVIGLPMKSLEWALRRLG
jgi:septum formation protein